MTRLYVSSQLKLGFNLIELTEFKKFYPKYSKNFLTSCFSSAIMAPFLASAKGITHAGNVRFGELSNFRISSVNKGLFMLLPAEV